MRSCLLIIALEVGCQPPHVSFAPLRPNLTPAERVTTFQEDAGVAEHVVTRCNGHACHTRRSVIFANGTEVNYPEDLLPLVGRDSETAHHIADRDASESRQHHAAIPGMLGLLVGGGLFLRSEYVSSTSGEWLGGGLALAGIVGLTIALFASQSAAEATDDAYASYSRDLARRLAVCVSGMSLVPCEGASPAASSRAALR